MQSIPVEYRADLDQRRGQITFSFQNAKKVTLNPGINQVGISDLQQLETIPYFQKGVENKIFIYTKPEIKQVEITETVKEPAKSTKPEIKQVEITETKQPETVKEPAKSTKPKATSLSSLTVDDDI